jgi:hypothetical protein
MGLMKFAARKGAVGGTARWVADRFLEALAHGLVDANNCQSSGGIEEEIEKIVKVSLESRYPESYHPFKEGILNQYNRIHGPGLAGFTVSILALEADWAKNTREYRDIFMEVIHEELEKKGVGEIMINGKLT